MNDDKAVCVVLLTYCQMTGGVELRRQISAAVSPSLLTSSRGHQPPAAAAAPAAAPPAAAAAGLAHERPASHAVPVTLCRPGSSYQPDAPRFH